MSYRENPKLKSDYPPEFINHIIDLYQLGKSKKELIQTFNLSLVLIDDWISNSHLIGKRKYYNALIMEECLKLHLENIQLIKEISNLRYTIFQSCL